MIHLRKSEDRGRADHGWLDTRHTFSFADYHDPHYMGFRSLRVINEDRVKPGEGFGTHPHHDMEILSVVLEGALEHKDNMGTSSVIRPGEIQRMTAGSGVLHSEFNPSKKDPVHFLQIWIVPEKRGLKPGYEQKLFPEAERRNALRLVAAPDRRDGSLAIHQDAELYATLIDGGRTVRHPLESGRHAWVQVTRGAVELNGRPMKAGDGAAVSGEPAVELAAAADSEVLLFDLA